MFGDELKVYGIGIRYFRKLKKYHRHHYKKFMKFKNNSLFYVYLTIYNKSKIFITNSLHRFLYTFQLLPSTLSLNHHFIIDFLSQTLFSSFYFFTLNEMLMLFLCMNPNI